MALVDVLTQVFTVVLALFAVALYVVVGSTRIRAGIRNVRRNLEATAFTVVTLGVVLVANGIVRDVGIELSWLIGVNVTGYIHAIEGNVVPALQSMANPTLTAFFGFVYIFGYTFLLTFPFAAYLVHDEDHYLHELVVAYIVNYGVGLVCYIVFIAYGPRNFLPDLVDPLLYTHWPQAQLLTSKVNTNTNVFPSLHTSLSITVALLAYRTRAHFPRWLPVAAFLAVAISISTMYLGIHWATDVVAGVLLAVVSIRVADRVVSGDRGDQSGFGVPYTGSGRLGRLLGR